MTSYTMWTKPVSMKVMWPEAQEDPDRTMKWRWKMLIRNADIETVQLGRLCLQETEYPSAAKAAKTFDVT